MAKKSLALFIIIIAFAALAVAAPASETGGDIAGHWAGIDIEKMLSKVGEVPDNKFFPDKPITPEEFNNWLHDYCPDWRLLETDEDYLTREAVATVVAENIGFVKVEGIKTPTDLADSAYPREMEKAMAVGVIRGYTDGRVRPGNALTKAEAAVILNRIDSLPTMEKGFRVGESAGIVRTQQGEMLKVGDAVYPGAKIITEAGGVLVLCADDSTTVRIGPNTTLEIEEYTSQPASGEKHTALVVWCGKIIGRVQKMLHNNSTFEIHTPTAVAGIRGTAFAVEVGESGDSRVSVYAGQVKVTGKNAAARTAVEVKANEETRIVALNQAPASPKKVDLELKDNWIRDEIKEALAEESRAHQDVPKTTIKIEKPKNTERGNNSEKSDKDKDDNNGNKGNNGNDGNSNNGNHSGSGGNNSENDNKQLDKDDKDKTDKDRKDKDKDEL